MKKLREGVSTGSCMTGGAEASVIWQTTGKCPSVVKVDTPIGKTLYLDIIPREFGVCGVVKDAGDDPDVTNGSEIVTKVELFEEEGDISFFGGEGVGTITQEGLKIPPGQPAINPVPRQMAEKAIRKIIGNKKANVTVSIPGGKELAKKTFNPRLGGTGETALKEQYGEFQCILQVSNYIGFMIEEAVERGFTDILIGGFVGKLVKVASGTMNSHSHVADGRIETICTHAALHGAPTSVIKKIYDCLTTKAAMKIVEEEGLMDIWPDMAQKASEYCEKTAHKMARVGIIFLDGQNEILAASENIKEVLSACKK